MNFLEKMESRYATKRYNPSKSLSDIQLNQLKKILRLCPSSINSQPWQFTFVEDEKVKSDLAEHSFFNERRIKDASCLVVFNTISNTSFFERQIQESLPEGHVQYYKDVLKPLGDKGVVSWMTHQLYLAIGVLLSACAAMDIDSTPMEGIKPAEYASILNLEVDYTPVVAVALGYRDESDRNQPQLMPKERLDFNRIIKSI